VSERLHTPYSVWNVLLLLLQDDDRKPWGGASSKLGAVASLYACAGGPEWYGPMGFRNAGQRGVTWPILAPRVEGTCFKVECSFILGLSFCRSAHGVLYRPRGWVPQRRGEWARQLSLHESRRMLFLLFLLLLLLLLHLLLLPPQLQAYLVNATPTRGGWTEDAWLDVLGNVVDALDASDGVC
jgi:hypothetical protein